MSWGPPSPWWMTAAPCRRNTATNPSGTGARSGRPVGAEPRVEVEAHRGPPPVRGPDRLRANPAQLFQALERALHDPGLRQPGPLLAVHLARSERARQP